MHVGSSVAICPPRVDLDDGGSYRPSPGQRWLWSGWEQLIERAAELKPDALVVNGDAGELDAKNRSYQVITQNRASVLNMVIDVLDPLVKCCKSMYVVRGTEAHTGKSAWLEEHLAEDYEAVGADGSHSWWWLPLQVEQVRLDIAHHSTMGGLPWTRSNAANKLAAIAVFNAADRGERIPDLVIRSHMHRWGDSYDAHRTRAIFTPAWTLSTAHTNRINPGAVAEVGALFIHINGSEYEVEKFFWKPRMRKWVTLA